HGDRPGRKILISGGGRCNFTNTGTRAENFLSENSHFARSALARFTPADMVALVEKHGIRFHEKTLGQLFCDDSARRIVTLLEAECGEAGVDLRCGVQVLSVHQGNGSPATDSPADRKFDRFVIETSVGSFACHSLVIATGGLSIPKMGATGFGYDIARQFGHRIVEPRPALVPLVLAPDELAQWSDLAGVSAEVVAGVEPRQPVPVKRVGTPERKISAGSSKKPINTKFREKLLITHRGLSGPAILQISSFWQPGAAIQIDLAPGLDVVSSLKQASAGRDRNALLATVKRVLPTRFAERWVELWLEGKTDWTNHGLDKAEATLHSWRLQPAGTEGFLKAEVTVGGVDTRELDARSMASLRVPGLHFIGEVVDVTGWLGGYNFQWAWASAAACGRNL
ncbi:MAG: NAD(P)/FAD-dependent oxidoreductase, partial [Janthinobacterium lividum]